MSRKKAKWLSWNLAIPDLGRNFPRDITGRKESDHPQDGLIWKSAQHESCLTHQNLQLCFWGHLDPTYPVAPRCLKIRVQVFCLMVPTQWWRWCLRTLKMTSCEKMLNTEVVCIVEACNFDFGVNWIWYTTQPPDAWRSGWIVLPDGSDPRLKMRPELTEDCLIWKNYQHGRCSYFRYLQLGFWSHLDPAYAATLRFLEIR